MEALGGGEQNSLWVTVLVSICHVGSIPQASGNPWLSGRDQEADWMLRERIGPVEELMGRSGQLLRGS